jgi:hypothetical protein
MNGSKVWRSTLITLALTLVAGTAASAQWTVGGYGVAEYDTKQTLLLLAGASASPRGGGIRPMVALQAYHLGYDNGSSRANLPTVRPAVGLTSGYNGGAAYGTVGYAFTKHEVRGAPVVGSDIGEGVVASGGWDYWGTGGPLGSQVLGSYNFGSESVWGRGRVTTRVSQRGAASTRIGAEMAYLSGPGYDAWQPGGVFEWRRASGQVIGLGAGAKLAGSGGNAAFFRVETYLPLAR